MANYDIALHNKKISFDEWKLYFEAETNCVNRGLTHDYKIIGDKMVCQRLGCGKTKKIYRRLFGHIKYSREH